jgi:hypothetical protein
VTLPQLCTLLLLTALRLPEGFAAVVPLLAWALGFTTEGLAEDATPQLGALQGSPLARWLGAAPPVALAAFAEVLTRLCDRQEGTLPAAVAPLLLAMLLGDPLAAHLNLAQLTAMLKQLGRAGWRPSGDILTLALGVRLEAAAPELENWELWRLLRRTCGAALEPSQHALRTLAANHATGHISLCSYDSPRALALLMELAESGLSEIANLEVRGPHCPVPLLRLLSRRASLPLAVP